MNEFIKKETENLDIHNLSKNEITEILIELLWYYGEIEMLPLYRWSWNHIRVYPWLWIEKIYNVWETKPIDFKKLLEDIKKLTKKEKAELHNIYKDEECIARKFDMKAYFFDEIKSWDLYYLYELLFLKLYKNWLVDINLFSFKYDIKTKSWKDLYAFMDKYIIKSNEFHSSETWKTEFDIKKILEESYGEFIKLFLESITLNWDDYGYDLSNRLDCIITIPSIKTFYIKLNSILSKYYEDNENLRNEFINILNKSDNLFNIPINEYFKEKVLFFEYLKYLEDKNKLEIKKIYLENNFLIFEIEKNIFNFDLLDLINFENKIKENSSKQIIYKYEFKENKLFINWEEFKIKDSEKTDYFIKLISLYLKSNNKKIVPIWELNDLYINITKDLKFLTLTSNNIKASYIKTIQKQLWEIYTNNEILKIRWNDIILM